MMDYGNIPVLRWEGAVSAKKASAQIHHAEPIILQMPDDFSMRIDAIACGCRDGKTAGNHVDCNADALLKTLARDNDLPELAELAHIAQDAGQVADFDEATHRIILHD